MANELDNEIGTLEPVKLHPSDVIIRSIQLEEVRKKDTKEVIGSKVLFKVSHPDSSEEIELSSVQYLKDKSVKNSATWYTLDKENKIAKNSALAELMRFYKVTSLKALVGKKFNTVLDERNYLTIKAY